MVSVVACTCHPALAGGDQVIGDEAANQKQGAPGSGKESVSKEGRKPSHLQSMTSEHSVLSVQIHACTHTQTVGIRSQMLHSSTLSICVLQTREGNHLSKAKDKQEWVNGFLCSNDEALERDRGGRLSPV